MELLTDPEEITHEDLEKALRTLGYDEDLFSIKSRCYVVSVHSVTPLSVQIGDNLSSSFKSRARDLMNDFQLKEHGPGDSTRDEQQYALFVN